MGWLQSGIFLSDAGWTHPSKSGGRSRSSRVDVHQTLNSFNQTLNGAAPSPILQPNTETGWVCPQNRSATKHSFGLAPSQKTGLDPTQPTQPLTKHTVILQLSLGMHRSETQEKKGEKCYTLSLRWIFGVKFLLCMRTMVMVNSSSNIECLISSFLIHLWVL